MIMKKKFIFFIIAFLFVHIVFAQKGTLNSKIKIYFNHPVNTSVSTGTNAVYLNDCVDDTLIKYINRAKYTIDVAVYNTNVASVVTAINAAYTRGVTVRWIYEGTCTNTALSNLNSSINKLTRTDGAGIMHNKFMIIDAGSATATDPVVWTGSANWTSYQIQGTGTASGSDYNNVVIIQDKTFATAYTTEFNEMWGSTTATPNSTNSKFGASKTDNTTHSFNVNGTTINLYFSPSDGTNNQIINSINTANTDLYFGMYTFTQVLDANPIVTKHNAGVVVAGIMDKQNAVAPYTYAYDILNPALGSNMKLSIDANRLYHNKYLIVDPSNTASDPLVFTGSHNWSASANTNNDENALIIHDATVANIYYQSFYQNFTDLGGTMPSVITSITDEETNDAATMVYPNPSEKGSLIYLDLSADFNLQNTSLIIYDAMGNKINELKNINDHHFNISGNFKNSGIYFYQLINKNELIKSDKIIIQ
jgi:phosphatidylserine/phosphatidylglycerophosphate/cardiolipin synthase-like enzyme